MKYLSLLLILISQYTLAKPIKVCVSSYSAQNLPGTICLKSSDCRDGVCKKNKAGEKRCESTFTDTAKYNHLNSGNQECKDSSDCFNGSCIKRANGKKFCAPNSPITKVGGICNSSKECDLGECRDRGDGQKVCFSRYPGYTEPGLNCDKDSDCDLGKCQEIKKAQ